ncbi:unnamed protein product [Plutella xylostella]|uniref:Regulatory protein zeste n=1 Tax=Plutella xylostella TaxID=51655 RepID=A0A8S4FVD0_PLUXY|nr:unnamed protein product [Plutella xylostella]
MDMLINIIQENKNVLENKKSDAVTWQEKESCWKIIEAKFNATSGATYRSAKNLKTKYEGLKRETRKKSACIRAETYRTGGGTSTAVPLTDTELKIKDMILLSVDGMKSDFDSDHVVTVGKSQLYSCII